MSDLRVIVIALVVPLWAVFTWWTIRKLWRSPNQPDNAWFSNATKIGSVVIAGFAAVCLPITIPMSRFEYWQLVIFWAVLFFPTMLWTVHYGIRMFRVFVER